MYFAVYLYSGFFENQYLENMFLLLFHVVIFLRLPWAKVFKKDTCQHVQNSLSSGRLSVSCATVTGVASSHGDSACQIAEDLSATYELELQDDGTLVYVLNKYISTHINHIL